MPFKVSFFFNQQSSKLGGWTENFWTNVGDRTTATSAATLLRAVLVDFKGNPVYCPYFRIANTALFRDSEPTDFPNAAPLSITPATDADYPTTKLQVQMRSANGRTTQWMGGLRDRDVTQGGRFHRIGGSVNTWNAIVTELTKGSSAWSVRILNPATPLVPVLAINGTTGVVTTAPNAIEDGSRVRIKGVKGMVIANTIWRVTKLSDTTFQLNLWTPTAQVVTKSNPTIRQQVYIFQQITAVVPVRSTSHKVGKPGQQLIGRRKRRAS